MEFRLWIGLWTSFILIGFAVFNLSFLVKYITRFTEDCFASLVAIMFILDSIKSVFGIYTDYPTKIGATFFIKKKITDECICNKTANSSYISDSILEIPAKLERTNITSYKSIYDENGDIKGCYLNDIFIKCKDLASEKFYPDIFMFSIMLFILTFTFCLMFKNFREKNYFPSKVITYYN